MTTKQIIKTLIRIGSDPHVLYLVQPCIGFTNQEWDDAIQEDLENLWFMEEEKENWEAGQLSNKEIEDIFEVSGVSREQMLMMKQNYIKNSYEELLRKENKNEKDLKKIQDLKNEYRYRFEMKGVNPNDIAKAKQYSIKKLMNMVNKFAKCPFHSEKTPSFCVYTNNTYHCFGCQANGDVIDLVKHLHNYDFQTAVKFLTV